MPMDGITLGAICNELRAELLEGKIDKIQQPEPDALLISVRCQAKTKKLLLTLGNQPRLHLTKQSYQNPQLAPAFCMLLRKHLVGGRVQDISRPGNERIVFIDILSANEMGDVTRKRLVMEIMGKYSNIILLNSQDMVMDAIRRVNGDISRVRQVMPHDAYTLPPSQDKMDLTRQNVRSYIAKNSAPTAQNLCDNFLGVSTVAAQEMLANGVKSLNDYMTKVEKCEFSAQMVTVDDEPADFLPFVYATRGKQIQYPSFSELLDDFCGVKDSIARTKARARELRTFISNQASRARKKQGVYGQKRLECEKMEQYRVYGELITANLYHIERGSKSATVANYYDPECKEITIPLDCKISPQANAQKYFKLYAKLKTASHMLAQQISQNDAELVYLESQLVNIDNCSDVMQLEEIKQELISQGYIRPPKKPVKITPSRPLRFVAPDGTEIYVGRNNLQNDELTLRLASKDDTWLHIKDAAGSHVIVRSNAPSNETLEIAAVLAAYFSKSKQSPKAAVDCTKVRFVKKPRGAKPGMVTYENYTTYYVTPSEKVAKQYAKDYD